MAASLLSAVQAIKDKVTLSAGNATPEELAYLGTALDRIGGRATVYEVVEMGDVKMAELTTLATELTAAMNIDTTAELAAFVKKVDDKIALMTASADILVTTSMQNIEDKRVASDTFITQAKDNAEAYITDTRNSADTFITQAKDNAEAYITDTRNSADTFITSSRNSAEAYITQTKDSAKTFIIDTRDDAETYIVNVKNDMSSYASTTLVQTSAVIASNKTEAILAVSDKLTALKATVDDAVEALSSAAAEAQQQAADGSLYKHFFLAHI